MCFTEQIENLERNQVEAKSVLDHSYKDLQWSPALDEERVEEDICHWRTKEKKRKIAKQRPIETSVAVELSQIIFIVLTQCYQINDNSPFRAWYYTLKLLSYVVLHSTSEPKTWTHNRVRENRN